MKGTMKRSLEGDMDRLKDEIINAIYPVGSIYISVSSTSPEILFGGSWEQIKDRFLLAAGSTYEAGSTGGEVNHKHNLPFFSDLQNVFNFVKKMPWNGWNHVSSKAITTPNVFIFQESSGLAYAESYTGYLAASEPESNMPPYLTVWVWKRVA